MEAKKTTAVKATEMAKKVRALVRDMYVKAILAKLQGQPVAIAYCMVGSLYDEILRAMDIIPIWTENYAALCAAKRVAEGYLMEAEADGFSNVICGYARTCIGFDALRKKLGQVPPNAPDGGMPEPDLLLGSSAICDPRYKWYQALGKYKDTPVYSLDVVVPSIDADLNEVKGYYIKYQAEELRGLVAFLERQLKRRLDYDRLWEIIKISDETNYLWWQVHELRQNIPCPMPSEDHFNCFVPSFFMMGTKEALDFYRELYNEVKERAEKKIGVIPDEKYRLLWAGGLPPWHTMWIFNYFETLGAVFVIETSYRPWDPVEVPPTHDPIEYIAHRHFLRFTSRYEKAKKNSGNPWVELILELIEKYKTVGMISHASRSCRATTIGQLHYKNLVNRYVKIPHLQLASDIVDLRDYSEAQWKMQIDAFIEAVATYKEKASLS